MMAKKLSEPRWAKMSPEARARVAARRGTILRKEKKKKTKFISTTKHREAVKAAFLEGRQSIRIGLSDESDVDAWEDAIARKQIDYPLTG